MRTGVILAAVAALGVSACTPSGSGVSVIQADAQLICGFLPAVATVEALLNLNSPTLQSATQIAQAICAAVAPKKSVRSVRAVQSVQGVPIRGRFVR